MKYNPSIPHSRGFKSQVVYKPQAMPTVDPNVNGFVFHSLISRVSYDDQNTEEYRPVLENNILELDIDQDKLDILTSKVTSGPKLNQWKWWLFGYDQYLNSYDDVVFNSINPYSESSDLGTLYNPWHHLYVNDISADGDVDITGILHVANDTQSVNTTTGAILVDGGVGIGKSLNVGGNETINGLTFLANGTESFNITSGALVIDGGVGIYKSLSVGGNFTLNGLFKSQNSTESSNITTGAITTSGGVGIGKNLNVGGNQTVSGLSRSTNTTDSSNVTTGAMVIDGGLGVNKTAHIGGQLYVNNLEFDNNLSLRSVSYNPSTGNISYGAEATMVLSASANYTVPANISNPTVLLCTLSTQDININMSSMPDGFVLNVKKLDKTAHLVKFNVTIDGDTSPSIKSQYESIAILKSSGSYYII